MDESSHFVSTAIFGQRTAHFTGRRLRQAAFLSPQLLVWQGQLIPRHNTWCARQSPRWRESPKGKFPGFYSECFIGHMVHSEAWGKLSGLSFFVSLPLFELGGSHYGAQASLQLLGSSGPPASSS
jgi:hypothetical protein